MSDESKTYGRRRLPLAGVLAVAAVLVTGLAMQRSLSPGQVDQQDVARDGRPARQRGEARCSRVGAVPIQGRAHFQSRRELAAKPPHRVYPRRPGSSGTHLGTLVTTGVYDKPLDERIVVHNLEHGYVAFWYDESADPTAVGRLQDFARDSIGSGFRKVVVAEYPGELPDGASFATVAWGHRQLCDDFDPRAARTFLDRLHDGLLAPEARLAPHLRAGPGVIDPDTVDGPLLFPPLGRADPTGGRG